MDVFHWSKESWYGVSEKSLVKERSNYLQIILRNDHIYMVIWLMISNLVLDNPPQIIFPH